MTEARDLSLAVIGVGHLADYTLTGLRRGGWRGELRLGPRGAAKAAELAGRCDGRVFESNADAAEGADLVLLATRPPQAVEAARSLTLTDTQTLVSVVAGLPLADLATHRGDAALARAMPVTAAEAGASPTMVYAEDPAVRAQVAGLFGLCGRAVPAAREADFDVGTALACVYGWFFELYGFLADEAEAAGLSHETALQMTLGMAEGAARVTAATGRDPHAIAEQIASPGSYTRLGLKHLEERDAFAPWVESFRLLMGKLREGR
jgi:pyrroline-5-carboxylate reductase